MKPIVVIHGYSAESDGTNRRDIAEIYGQLPKALRREYGGRNVVEIDLSRYISLDDGISVEDISHALDRVLKSDKFSHLLKSGFHTIVHSTGALVIRNWLRRFSPPPSPLNNLVYLAGANFGSGWAHIGKGQLAKWGRMVLQGAERGVQVLSALELGSSWTIDLHLHFLDPANSLPEKYKVFEHVIIGTQSDAQWFMAPVRYAKEDGADGVVRVSGSNLNFNYIHFGPTGQARQATWKEANQQVDRDRRLATAGRRKYYDLVTSPSQAGIAGRPVTPFAIPYETAHSGENMGIVQVRKAGDQVMKLIDSSLKTNAGTWTGRVEKFQAATEATYRQAISGQAPRGFFGKLLTEPRAQYDKHAQIIIRLRDQDGQPVLHYDIFFNSKPGNRGSDVPINKLIEDKHVNGASPNVMTFYLRTDSFDSNSNQWEPQVPRVNGCNLEITATEPATDEILYLPFRWQFSKEELSAYIQPHRTTIIDIDLLRLPSPDVFRMVKY